jgi:hypothetical protein
MAKRKLESLVRELYRHRKRWKINMIFTNYGSTVTLETRDKSLFPMHMVTHRQVWGNGIANVVVNALDHINEYDQISDRFLQLRKAMDDAGMECEVSCG